MDLVLGGLVHLLCVWSLYQLQGTLHLIHLQERSFYLVCVEPAFRVAEHKLSFSLFCLFVFPFGKKKCILN